MEENEEKIADFNIIISSGEIVNILNRFLDAGTGESIAGLTILPLREESDDKFHVYGFYITLAIWTVGQPETIKFWGIQDNRAISENVKVVLSANTELLPENLPENQRDRPTIIHRSGPANVWELVNRDLDKKLKFDNSSEFELVFIELDLLKYYARIRSLSPNNFGRFVLDPGIDFGDERELGMNEIGLQISRAFFEMDAEGNDLTRYRTLKFNPYPEPNLPSQAGRASFAYFLGAPCPPIWVPTLLGLNFGMSENLQRLINLARTLELIPESSPRPFRLGHFRKWWISTRLMVRNIFPWGKNRRLPGK